MMGDEGAGGRGKGEGGRGKKTSPFEIVSPPLSPARRPQAADPLRKKLNLSILLDNSHVKCYNKMIICFYIKSSLL